MLSDYATPKIYTKSVLAISGWKCDMPIFKCIMLPFAQNEYFVSCYASFISKKNAFYKIWIIYMIPFKHILKSGVTTPTNCEKTPNFGNGPSKALF